MSLNIGHLGGSVGWAPTLNLRSGNYFLLPGIKPHIRLCADSMELAWDSLSPLSASPPLTLSLNLCLKINFKTFLNVFRGGWVVHSVKHLTSAGHNLTAHGFKPHIRLSADIAKPAWDSHSLPLSLPLPDLHLLSLSK